MTTGNVSSYPWQHGQSGCVKETDIDQDQVCSFLRQNTSCSLIFLTTTKKMPLLQKLTTNLFSRENTCSKMYRSYMKRFWKEYKHQWWNLVLREHMPKEETSRQQVTNSHSRSNRLYPLPTQSTWKDTTLARHVHRGNVRLETAMY